MVIDSVIEFTIPKRCPSIQGNNVGRRLTEWQAFICEALCEQGFLEAGYNSPVEGIRRFALLHLSGLCYIEIEFRLRATKRLTDLDNMLLFIITCFRTEMTSEAKEIEKEFFEEFGIRPWFYYPALGFPGNLDFRSARGTRYHGEPDDLTRVRVGRLERWPPETVGPFSAAPERSKGDKL